MKIIVKRRVDGPSAPELGTPVATTFDSVTIPLARPSTGPAAITEYEIQRSAGGITFGTIASGPTVFGNPSQEYVDGGRVAGATYYYRARATDASGRVSAYSNVVNVTMPEPQAQNVTFIIGTNVTSFNGNSATDVTGTVRAVVPGDVIQFAAGNHLPLTIRNINETFANAATAPTRVRIIGPDSGVATFRANGSTGIVLQFIDTHHFTVDGWRGSSVDDLTNTANFSIKVTYTNTSDNPGFFIKNTAGTTKTASNCTYRGIWIDGGWTSGTKSSHIGFHVHHNGASRVSGPFVGQYQENVTVEYCRVERCYGEGFYFGPNYTANSIPLRNIIYRYNYAADNGRDGMQAKCWWSGTNQVYGNRHYNNGNRTDEAGQCFGISILSGQADVFDNWIQDSGESGIQFYTQNGPTPNEPGYGPLSFTCDAYNNVVLRSGQTGPNTGHGITCSGDNTTVVRVLLRAFNNTLWSNQGSGISVGANANTGCWARNNIALDNGAAEISMGQGTQANNTTTGTASAIFQSVTVPYDFHLQSAIAASGTVGTDIAATDYDGDTRSAATADRGAFEYP